MNEPQSLQELLDAAASRHGLSMRQLALKARDAGYRVVDTTLNSIRNGTYKSRPREETVRAIGWLAGVTEEVAFTAAGLRVPGPPFADELPPGVDNLSPRKRKAVIELLRVLVDDEEAGGEHEQRSASMYGAGTPPAQDQTRETPPVSPASERLTDDESTDPTGGSGSHDLERTTLVLAELFREGLAFAPARAAEQRHRREVRRRVSAALDAEGTIDDATRYLAQIADAALSEPESAATSPTPDEAADNAHAEPAADHKPSKLERLRRLQEDAATVPASIAARDVGRPSRGQQLREEHDAAAERSQDQGTTEE